MDFYPEPCGLQICFCRELLGGLPLSTPSPLPTEFDLASAGCVWSLTAIVCSLLCTSPFSSPLVIYNTKHSWPLLFQKWRVAVNTPSPHQPFLLDLGSYGGDS